MSGRTQALMRTRCPACGTVFRVTSEQLRLKAGKVRCGQCQTVFNAFDQFLADETPAAASPLRAQHAASPAVEAVVNAPPSSAAELVWPQITDEPATKDGADSRVEDAAIGAADTAIQSASDTDFPLPEPSATLADDDGEDHSTTADEAIVPAAETINPPDQPIGDGVSEPVAPDGEPLVATPPDTEAADAEAIAETPEQSTEAARQAGLVAARELSEGPAYNRWAAGTLADAGGTPFAPAAANRAVWPFVVVSLLLLVALAGQFIGHFRTEVVRWLPAAESYYEMAGLSVPLPRNPEMVAIEASDLQADNARGLFVLQATLHNRAAYAQDWPALELTLTDAADSVVARKVMSAADYLPPAISPERFPANGEVAVRLWIEARDLGAAGYRLYVFYP